MIYRGLECAVYGDHMAPVTVWFQARAGAKAHEKLVRLLSLAWDVDPADVCVGNVDDEDALERDALVSMPRQARWFLVGSSQGGMVPIFDTGPTMLMLDGVELRRWRAARDAAGTVARRAAQALAARQTSAPAGPSGEYVPLLSAFADATPCAVSGGSAEVMAKPRGTYDPPPPYGHVRY